MLKLSRFIFLLFLFFNFQTIQLAHADTIVYFFEYRLPNGTIYSFDKDGRFYHVALKYHNQYLEAHPYYGVHLANDINKIGQLKAALRHSKSIKDLDKKVQLQIGKKFDLFSDWNDLKTTQCSKLIGQIIGVSPVLHEDGKLTLSPDSLYNQLKIKGFTECQSCLLQP